MFSLSNDIILRVGSRVSFHFNSSLSPVWKGRFAENLKSEEYGFLMRCSGGGLDCWSVVGILGKKIALARILRFIFFSKERSGQSVDVVGVR